MSLSVVITTFNRSDVLKQNLDCFLKQTDMDFEIVVAIDGGTDNTPEMLAAYEAPFAIKWVDTLEHDTYCLAKARNMGIVETTRPIVVILDDDSFPAPGFVAAHKATATMLKIQSRRCIMTLIQTQGDDFVDTHLSHMVVGQSWLPFQLSG